MTQKNILSLDQIAQMYGISKPTLIKIKKNSKNELDLTSAKPFKILDTAKNHHFFQNLAKQRQGKWAGKSKQMQANWQPIINHYQVFPIPMELHAELTQNKVINMHIHHECEEIVDILHTADQADYDEMNNTDGTQKIPKNKYSKLIEKAFLATIEKIQDDNIKKINVVDLDWQLAYVWPYLYQNKKISQIQKYVCVDMSIARLRRVLKRDGCENNPHPLLAKWPLEAQNKLCHRSNTFDNLLRRMDLIRTLYQQLVFNEKDDTSSIHFLSQNHLDFRSYSEGMLLLSNVRRSMDKKDYLIISFHLPSDIQKSNQKFGQENRHKKSHTFTIERILQLQENVDYEYFSEEEANNTNIYAKMLKNVNIHFGKMTKMVSDEQDEKNLYQKTFDFDRWLALLKGEKILVGKKTYMDRKEKEQILQELGLEVVYFDFDRVLEMGVFVCKILS